MDTIFLLLCLDCCLKGWWLLWNLVWTKKWIFILGLTVMDLTFSIVAFTLLCFVVKKVFWIKLSHAQTASRLSLQPHHQRPVGLGKGLWGDTANTADPKQPKGYSIPRTLCSAIKSQEKGAGGHLILTRLSSKATTKHAKALLPWTWLEIASWCSGKIRGFCSL